LSSSFFQTIALDQGMIDQESERLTQAADSVRMSLLKHQLDVLEDPAKSISAICPRRAGKSWTAMSYCFDECLRKPGAHAVIVTLTLKSARNIYWNEIKMFAKRFGISIETYKNELLIEFTNGSQIFMIGAESRAQIEKLRGGKYDLCVIDEAKSYPPDILRELIYEVVEPALLDRDGTMLMIGTPGNILSGPFFEATYPGHRKEAMKDENGKDIEQKPTSCTFSKPEKHWIEHPDDEAEWSRHTWTLKDNTTTPHAWARACKSRDKKGWTEDNPAWRREYLGEWVASEAAYVYSYASLAHTEPERVSWVPDFVEGNQFGLPSHNDWHYVMGIDLGFEDDFAICIGAYNPHDGVLYQCYEFKEPGLDVDECALEIAKAFELCDGKVDKVVADTGGLGKQIIETMRKRYGFAIEPAEKREKLDYVNLLNSDYHAGRVKIIAGGELAFEKKALQWDLGESSKKQLARTGRLKEHHACPNHLCDAWLYLWRFSYHYWEEERPMAVEQGSAAFYQQQERRAMKRLADQRQQTLNETFWDDIRGESVDPLKDIDSLWN
jgi:hypothetical protein